MIKRVTAKAVAQLAGISKITVYFILSNISKMRIGEETHHKVLEVAQQLDYIQAYWLNDWSPVKPESSPK